MSKVVRINDKTEEMLDELSKTTGKSKRYILEKAIDGFCRDYFLKKAAQQSIKDETGENNKNKSGNIIEWF